MFLGFIFTLPKFDELAAQDFWINLYAHGKIGIENPGNILVVLLIRLAVIVLLLMGTRVLVGVMRRVIHRGLKTVIERTGKSSRRLFTLQGLLTSSLSYCVYFVTLILILFTMGVTWKGLAPLIGAASILGLAIGFGAQKLVRDIITGLFILGEGQFDVGDWVTIGGVNGCVEDIGLRVTRLRDDQGRAYVVANGDITQVFNASRGNVALTIEVSVARTPGFDSALTTLREVVEEEMNRLGIEKRDDRLVMLVTGMDAAKVTVRLVMRVPVGDKARTEDAIRRRILHATPSELVLA